MLQGLEVFFLGLLFLVILFLSVINLKLARAADYRSFQYDAEESRQVLKLICNTNTVSNCLDVLYTFGVDFYGKVDVFQKTKEFQLKYLYKDEVSNLCKELDKFTGMLFMERRIKDILIIKVCERSVYFGNYGDGYYLFKVASSIESSEFDAAIALFYGCALMALHHESSRLVFSRIDALYKIGFIKQKPVCFNAEGLGSESIK